jgi:hypothetical protein
MGVFFGVNGDVMVVLEEEFGGFAPGVGGVMATRMGDGGEDDGGLLFDPEKSLMALAGDEAGTRCVAVGQCGGGAVQGAAAGAVAQLGGGVDDRC